jgi:valyl-tRNA synthetase
LREIRARQNIPPREMIHFVARADPTAIALLKPMEPYFESMAGAKADSWGANVQPPANAASFSASGIELFVDLASFIDVEAEIVRLTKDVSRLESGIAGKERQLANGQFVSRAPVAVIEKERAALAQMKEQLVNTLAALEALKSKR